MNYTHAKLREGYAPFVGQTITKCEFDPEYREEAGCLLITFDTGKVLRVWDDVQYCCEKRYMTMDDSPAELVGGKLKNIKLKRHLQRSLDPDDIDWEEIQFVEIQTDKTFITLCTHNEHNGYYGGFDIQATEHVGTDN